MTAVEKLRQAYERGGLSGLSTTVTSYLQWRLAGSPPEAMDSLHARLDRVDAALIVALMRDYYADTEPVGTHLITVILPTKDRPIPLQRAVQSVIDQKCPHWELIIVNDSALPLTGLPDDQRVRVIESGGVGAAGARNRGLQEAKGRMVSYLDDDNVMDGLWLKAIALTLDETPQAKVLIGAQLVAPDPGHPETHTLRFPTRFSWKELTEANFIDMGMLAHTGPSPIEFDVSLPAMIDWDFVVRLTIGETPVLVPAISGTYLTGSPRRISYRDRHRLLRDMRRRFAEMTPSVPDLVVSQLGEPDVLALIAMLGRLAESLGRPLNVRGIGGPVVDSLMSHIALTTGCQMVADTDEETVDVIVIDKPLPGRDIAVLTPDGFVVGINGSEADYTSMGLPHTRLVGDHLWVGSPSRFDAESLFDGATLVKMGTASEG